MKIAIIVQSRMYYPFIRHNTKKVLDKSLLEYRIERLRLAKLTNEVLVLS